MKYLCQNQKCGVEFEGKSWERRRFCSRSCAAVVNNTSHPKRKAAAVKFHKKRRESLISQYLNGTWDGTVKRGLSRVVRNYLIELADGCSVCGFDERHPSDGSSVLEIDHIDGDCYNNRLENLQVLCPNHHALTPTYRGRNKGKGRVLRYAKNGTSM